MSLEISIARRAEQDMTLQYRWYLDHAGELRGLTAALKQRDGVALELLVKGAFGRCRLVHVGLGYYPTFAVRINEEGSEIQYFFSPLFSFSANPPWL